MVIGVATMLAVLGMGYLSLRVVQRMRQFKHLASEISHDYRALDAEFPFVAPLLPSAPEPERMDAYYRARNSFAAHIAPPIEVRARGVLQNGEAATMSDIARLFGSFYQLLDQGTDAHLDVLRQEEMGPSEFFWIHGYVLDAILDAPENDPRRTHLEWTLDALERGSAPLTSNSRQFVALEFRKDLDRRYSGYPAMNPSALEPFAIEGETLACMDIIAATAKLHEGLGIRLLPPVIEVRTAA
jgi:hypothetical protein